MATVLSELRYCITLVDDFSGIGALKGPSNEIFDLQVHHSNLSGPLTNGLNYFLFWLTFRRVIQILLSKKLGVKNIAGLSI